MTEVYEAVFKVLLERAEEFKEKSTRLEQQYSSVCEENEQYLGKIQKLEALLAKASENLQKERSERFDLGCENEDLRTLLYEQGCVFVEGGAIIRGRE